MLQIHKDWYFAIGELTKQKRGIDIVTVTDVLRENNRLSKDAVYQTSLATTDVPYIRIESLMNTVNFQYQINEVNKFARDFIQKMESPNFSPDDVIQLCDKTKSMLLDVGVKSGETNDQIIQNVISRHNDAKNGVEFGLQLGWDGTYNKIILENIDVMVVGGRPAMGKTAWLVSCAKQMAFDLNKKVCVFSLEMSNAQIMRRMLATITGIDSNKIKLGQCSTDELKHIYAVQSSKGWDNLIFIDGSQKVADISRKVTELKNTTGLDVYMVDYMQKIIPEKTENRYTEVTRISNDIKRLTMSVEIPCIAMAQLSRDSAKTGKRPSLPDLKESGEIEQDASVVAFLHRAEYYGETQDDQGMSTQGKGEFLIAKNREGETGIVPMVVELSTSTWGDDLQMPDFNNTKPVEQYQEQNPF
jgi:replicative DNA helicase